MSEKNSQSNSRRNFLRGVIAGSSLAAVPNVAAQAPSRSRKRIYIAADDHTDYMWTADEAAYRNAFLKMLDHYLDLADRTDKQPSDFQSRWNCDGLLWFREYEKYRSEKNVARLVRRIKSGHISIPMTILVSCYGGAPTEAILRGLYYGGHVERKYDLRLRIAVSMENQTLPYGLGMLWAGSGVRYSWKGICSCATKLGSPGNREHDVYWWVGPDGSRILMKWYSLGPKLRAGMYPNEGPGGYAEARDPKLAIEYVDNDADFKRRNPHEVIGLFGQGWDDLITRTPLRQPQNSFPMVAKAMSNSNRRVIVSDENDYFADMEETHGEDLPEVRAAFGNEWELYSASMAEVSASVKRATEKLRAAEAMASVVALKRPAFADDLMKLRDQAWIAYGLYWEHDWTADGPISRNQRAAWQRKIAKQIHDYVEALYARSVKQLAELISASDESSHVFVFNPLGWERTDVASLQLESMSNLEVVDAETGQVVPSQWVTRDGKFHLQFLAANVPACGYKVFRLQTRSESVAKPSVQLDTSGKIETKQHTLQVDQRGFIRSWTAKSLGEKLVGSDGVANQIEKQGGGVVSIETSGPVSTTIKIQSDPPLSRTTRITIFEDLDRIDIENTIEENFGDVRSWRFDFAIDNPKTYHEEVGAILSAAFQSEGGDYADRNSRTDWLTLNHFLAMHDNQKVVTLSASDCQFFHLGENPNEQMDSSSNTVHVLAGGQVDGPRLGIPRQGGDRRFLQRFSLKCAKYNEEKSRGDSMRFSLEHQNPLVVGAVEAGAGEMPQRRFSLVQLTSDDAVLWAVKPSEDGMEKGLIVRLWNLANKETDVRLAVYGADGLAKSKFSVVTHVETDLEKPANNEPSTQGSYVGMLPPYSIRTLRCK